MSGGAAKQYTHVTDTDNIIPSLQHLRQAGDIHRKDLEQASASGSTGNFELLLEALNKKQNPWPQDLALVGSM